MNAFLAACGQTNNDPGPGGVSVEDARTLDEAAAELDNPLATTENSNSDSE